MKYLLPLFTAALLLTACIPDPLPLEIDQLDPAPVVWSQAIPGESVVVYLARTFGALEYDDGNEADSSGSDLMAQLLTSGGIVSLSGAGDSDTLYEITAGLYATLDATLIPGEEYTLRVYDPGLNKEVTSTARMMASVPLTGVSYTAINDSTLDIHYSFIDPPGANFYAVHFYSQYNDPTQIPDPMNFAEQLGAGGEVETELISDLELNSSVVSRSFRLEFVDSDTVFVSLNNVSEEFYTYMQQRKRSGNLFTQAVSEPISYSSNIQGGYGIFTLHFPDVEMIVTE